MHMAALRARLREHLDDWRLNLEPTWREFFAESPEPDFDAIPEELQIDDDAMIWPGSQGAPVADALAAPHICRAFDGIVPPDVRVVVLGQDPYPSRAKATGRAFEDGNWDGNTRNLAHSFKPLVLAALATRVGHEALFRPGQWDEVRRQIAEEGLEFPELGACFDRLAGQGVMFVNAAWTHTTPGDIDVHLALWRPVLYYLLRKLAREAQDPLVFLLLGKKASNPSAGAV
jgi:uracil-DNA glycosylase